MYKPKNLFNFDNYYSHRDMVIYSSNFTTC